MRTGAADLLLDTLGGSDRETGGRWSAVDTRGLDRLVTHEGCAIWLSRRLRELGAEPPAEFSRWLDRRVREDTAKNLMVDAEADALLSLLSDRDVPHVFLKGVAWRLRGGSPLAGARPLHDVDVLVPESRAPDVWNALVARGYTRVLPEDHGFVIEHHLPALFAPGGVSVELHTSTTHHGRAADSWNRIWPGAVTLARGGRRTKVPAMTEMLWQTVEHAVHDQTSGFRLRRWLDAVVALRSGEPIRWPDIALRLTTGEIADPDAARAWLGAAAALAGASIPGQVVGSVAAFGTRRALRWRVAVAAKRPLDSRVAIPLLEEGTRGALGWPLSPSAPHRSPYVRARHRLAAAAARAWYRGWSALHSR